MINRIKVFLDLKLTGSIGTKNSFMRDEWVKSQLLCLDKDQKILDAGAGESQYKKYCTHLKYTAHDISIYDGIGNLKGIQKGDRNYSSIDIISDIYDIPVANETFDAILFTEVLEHLTDPVKVFNELNRILKKEGTLIMTAPFNSLTHYSPYHYSTGFTINFYEYHLQKFGFEIISIEPNGNYFDYISQELRRINSISTKYSNLKLGFIYKISIKILLNFMKIATKSDSGSSELLCYGYHVKCKKVNSL